MDFEITTSFKRLKKDWESIYNEMTNPSPFLHHSAFEIAHRYFYPYYFTKMMRPCFGVFSEQDQVIAIVPLVKYIKGKYKLFGFANGFNWGG